MTNEEIKKAIEEQYAIIGEEAENNCSKFELNAVITECRKKIVELQKQCTHLNHSHEVQTFNDHCIYCGKYMG